MKKLIKLTVIALCLCLGITALTACGASFDPNKPIIVVSRESGSGTRDAFMELVYLSAYPEGVNPVAKPDGSGNFNYWETVELPDNTISQASTAAVLSKIKSDPQAIGYDSLGYVTDAVKKLTVGGVECTPDNIRNGSYKIARPLSIVYKEATLLTGANAKFHEYLMSSEAQTIIADEGYISDTTRVAAYSVQAGLLGTVKVSGSTSLQPLMNKLAEAFRAKQTGVTVEVTGGGSGTGRNNVRDNVSHFGMVSAAVSEAQLTAIGGEAAFTKICDDGIAIIVHKTNTVNNITIDQLKNIYNKAAATKYSNWAAMA